VEFINKLIEVFLHLDVHLNDVTQRFGGWIYGLLFTIIFCETGLVVTPFLPGDSLLFAVGALAATEGSVINLPGVAFLLSAAAILGDAANYAIGKRVGPAIFSKEDSRFFKKAHLMRAHEFYEKYGGKTIVIARFVPIIRTFAPFVAGIGKMGYFRFAMYNVTGGVAWVLSFLLGGYLFGNIPWVKNHFSIITIAIIVISVMPLGIELLKARLKTKREAKQASPAQNS